MQSHCRLPWRHRRKARIRRQLRNHRSHHNRIRKSECRWCNHMACKRHKSDHPGSDGTGKARDGTSRVVTHILVVFLQQPHPVRHRLSASGRPSCSISFWGSSWIRSHRSLRNRKLVRNHKRQQHRKWVRNHSVSQPVSQPEL